MSQVVEDEGDGSGSIKDFRNKMWRLAQEEQDDTWVAYDWREGEVSLFPGQKGSYCLL